MTLNDCVLQQFEEVISGLVLKSVVYGITKLRSLGYIFKRLFADVYMVVNDVGWMLLFVVDSYQHAILFENAEHAALTRDLKTKHLQFFRLLSRSGEAAQGLGFI